MKTKSIRQVVLIGIALIIVGISSVAATFVLVGQSLPNPDKMMSRGGGRVNHPPVANRLAKWARQTVSSGFTDWGMTNNGTPVVAVLREAALQTIVLGFSAWGLAWVGGLLLGIVLAERYPSIGDAYLRHGAPALQAVPPVAVVVIVYLELMRAGFRQSPAVMFAAGIVTLAALMLPAATSQWVAGIRRIRSEAFIQAALARGLTSWQLWKAHLLRHVLASSGVPESAALSLAQCLGGSILIEQAFGLGKGLGTCFVEGVTLGEAEQAAACSAFVFFTTGLAVFASRSLVAALDSGRTKEEP